MPYTSLTSTTQSGALKVLASTANDFPGLKNTTNGTVRVNFTAKGQWCLYNVPTKDPELVIFNTQTDWKGIKLQSVPNWTKYNWIAFNFPAGILVAEIKDPRGTSLFMIGAPAYVELAPGCTAEFFMNDDPRFFGDNSGEITLSYNCTPAASIGTPLVKTFQGDSPRRLESFYDDYKTTFKKMISYAGFDFYPYATENDMKASDLRAAKEGPSFMKGFTMSRIGRNSEMTDIIIEPELQMVRFLFSGSSARYRIPWCYLADTFPTVDEKFPEIQGGTYGQPNFWWIKAQMQRWLFY